MTNALVLRATAFVIAGCLTAAAQTTSATKPAGASAKTGTAIPAKSSSAGQASTATAGAATGDRPSEADVKQMLTAMHARQNNERLLKQIEPLLQRASNQAAMANPNLDEADRKFMKDLQDEEEAKMLAPEFLDQIIAASVPAYMKNLSASDVRQITAFYNSPAGQHLETALPDISKQAMDAALPLMQQRARDVIGDQQKRISEYMAKKHPQPAGGSPGSAGASSGASGASPGSSTGTSSAPGAPGATSSGGSSSTASSSPASSTEGATKSGAPGNAAPQSSTNPATPGTSKPEGPKH